jgi:acid phosphatase
MNPKNHFSFASFTIALFFLLIAFSFANAELNFFVIGDYGFEDKPAQARVAQAMGRLGSKIELNFILTVGDNFQKAGVKSVDDPLWQKVFEKVYSAPCLKQVPWYITLGNHDYNGNVQAEIDYTKKGGRWYLPARYYSFIKKVDNTTTAEFFVIDTNPLIDSYYTKKNLANKVAGQDTTAQLKWLAKALSASQAQWKFVVGHHPLYSGGQHGGYVELQRKLQPLFEKYQVDAYFCGHDHTLQYLKPKGYTHYLISGAGADLYDVNHIDISQFAISKNGFLRMSLDAKSMHIIFVDDKGLTLYYTIVEK